jgi:capsular exopolysaccharide synthesis family protein
MDLSRYFKMGLRWWWLMLISMALSAAASYFYSQDLPRIYSARTTLMVGTNITESSNLNERDIGLSRTLAQVYGELAVRRPVTQAVIDRLGLDMSPEQLSSMIKANVIQSAQLLEIFVLDVHPQRAQLLANAIAEELIRQTPGGASGQQERDSFIRAQLQGLQVKIEDTNVKIEELENSLDSMTSAVEIAEAQSKLSQLEKLKTDYQSSYNQFLSNLSESSPNRLTVFEAASEPTSPISPNVQMNVALAAAAGLVLAFIAIVFLEFVNDTLVWQQGETESVLGVPVLGVVSKMSGNLGSVITSEKLWSPEVNTLRSLRDSIFLAAEGKSISTLLVTSAVPGEGKSFLSTHLAAAIATPSISLSAVIASPGSKVILVDVDLRKPSLHEKFDMPNLIGLADVLVMPDAAVEKMLIKALKSTRIDNLYLLPAGRNPLDPGSLLNSPKFLYVLKLLKSQADLVILDSGPILEVVETRAIAKAVDATVLVISHGFSRRRVLQKALNYFKDERHGHLLGLVFNRVNLSLNYDYHPHPFDPKFAQAEKLNRRPSLIRKLWPFGRRQQLTETAVLNLTETADYLGVNPEIAQRWCEQGRIPAVKKGRHWSVRLEDLNEFITFHQGTGTSDTNVEEMWALSSMVETDTVNPANGNQAPKTT